MSPRRGGHGSLVASLAVLLASGALPLAAQQRIEIVRARAPQAEPADSTERQLRRLQRQLDSLARVYNEHDDLTMAERKRVEEDLGRAIKRMTDLSAWMNRSAESMMRPGDQIRIQMAPQTAVRASASMSRAMMQVREAEQATPRGWIGVVPQGPGLTPWVEGGQLLVRYFAYPRVLSVDPSSPAQRAGIVPNDTLVSFNGVDLSENDISLTRLLVPNSRINIRIKRDGKVHEVPVTVAAVPYRIVQRRDDESRLREAWEVAAMPEAPSFPRIVLPTPAPGAPVRVSARSATVPAAPRSPDTPLLPGSIRPSIAFGFGYGNGVNAVAGAQLSTISDGLGRALGVSAGVLVTSAPVGSPASESGLVDGDVISKVAGQAVRRVSEVRDLVALAADNGDHAVELEIVRQKKGMKLSLRW